MAGGLMQLVAYGAQDVYLTGNAQITLFKVIYRRHTNFATECIDLPVETAKPGARVSIPVLRNADLITKAYMRLTLPELRADSETWDGKVAWVRRFGHAAIKNIVAKIGGGSEIDKHYGVWLDVWYELTHTTSQERGYAEMIGDVPELTTLADSIEGGRVVFIPLQFWFCRNYGLALPLIALQYHEVRMEVEFESVDNLVVYSLGVSGDIPRFSRLAYNNSGLLIDYIFLDQEERRRFAQVGHEYLIEQLQYYEGSLSGTGNQETTQSITLNFNHPSKELVWAHRLGAFNGASSSLFLAYTNLTTEDAWSLARLSAAERLARSMISAAQVAGPNGEEVVTIAASTAYHLHTAANGTVFRFSVANPDANPCVFVVNYEPLKAGAFNLADKVASVSVDLTVVTPGANNVVAVSALYVTEHSLTMEDISTPLSAFTDTRLAAAKAGDVRVVQLNNYGLRLDGKGNMVVDGKLILNGQDRFATREGPYFNYVQPFQHHTRTPTDGINVYSFALQPEQHQPTGTCNMSRIDSTKLQYRTRDIFAALRSVALNIYINTIVYVFDVNYNVLRLMSGMGGLAYTN